MSEQKHITAMRLLVEFRGMKDLCNERTNCDGCPFFSRKVCDMQTTESIIEHCANVFYEYLMGLKGERK